MEREVLTVLKFKLLPDTLNFWLDLGMRLWDLYVDYDTEVQNYDCRLYKPREVYKDYNRYDAMRHPF